MSAIDYRYPVAVFLKYRGEPHEARVIPPDLRDVPVPYLVVSCVVSVELLLSCGISESRILWFLGNAMNAPWLLQRETFNNIPNWLKLSTLPQVVLVKFKTMLLKEIEQELIASIDPDPEE